MDFGAQGFFVVLALFGFIQNGLCFQCYTCAGAPITLPETLQHISPEIKSFTSACADPFRQNELMASKVECNDGTSVCTKMIIKAGEVDVVMRGCFPEMVCASFKHCHTCTGNLCNSSSAILPSIFIVAVISLIVAKLNL